MAEQGPRDSYDETPYVKQTYVHVDGMAIIATLQGMRPASVAACRVLELGCGSGSNLIAMAYGLPESRFLGIDLSARQSADGQAMVAALGLPNVEIRQGDILAVDERLGQFDYIIAHGVYSWVPSVVREKVLSICRERLAPNGVACISYNVFPGWHQLLIVREMLRYHTRDLHQPQERLAAARAFLAFLGEASHTRPPLAASLAAANIGDSPEDNALLLHGTLAEINTPFYLHEFVAQAGAQDLQYLGDLRFSTMLPSAFPPSVRERLAQVAKSPLETEQYLDFVRNRTFRQSLLCHRGISLSRTLSGETLAALYVASSAQPCSAKPNLRPAAVERFQTVEGVTFDTDHPVTKAAFLHLARHWPRALPFMTLLHEARALARSKADISQDAQILGTNLLAAYGATTQLMRLHVHAPLLAATVSPMPEASALARLQVQQGQHRITNLWHVDLSLEPFLAFLLPYLDGSRDRAALLALLVQRLAEGKVPLEGLPSRPEQAARALARALDQGLQRLARMALLVR